MCALRTWKKKSNSACFDGGKCGWRRTRWPLSGVPGASGRASVDHRRRERCPLLRKPRCCLARLHDLGELLRALLATLTVAAAPGGRQLLVQTDQPPEGIGQVLHRRRRLVGSMRGLPAQLMELDEA
jgi:hypothetical protein